VGQPATFNLQLYNRFPMLGEQIIKGMAVTAKNFFGSYVSKDRLTTVQYPEERLSQKANTRQFPLLVL
jgi:NADH-quinone oxidoreductase subunit I